MDLFNMSKIGNIFKNIDKTDEVEIMFNNYRNDNKLTMEEFIRVTKMVKLLSKQQNKKLKQSFFCVCNSDNLYSEEAFKLIKGNDYDNAFLSYDRDSLDFPKERVSSFSVVKLDNENNLKAIIEKPTKEQVNNNLDLEGKVRVNMNLFKFSGSKFFKFLEECPFDPVRNEKELPTAMINMIKSKESYVKGIPIAEHVPDLTSKSDIITISKFFE